MTDRPKTTEIKQDNVQKLKEEGRLKPFPEDLKKRHEERLRQSETTEWLPINEHAPDEVIWLANHAEHPKLGQHVGRVLTMADGRWIVLRHDPTGGAWENYMILPSPPL